MFWETTHEDLDRKINRLDSLVSEAQGFNFFGFHKWDETFDLIKEIQEDFKKKIRYPTKAGRDAAWQRFFNLREEAYRTKRQLAEEKSKKHFGEINGYLRDAEYDGVVETIANIVSLGLLRTTPDDMKWKGKRLREAGGLFKSVKHEMTREHKAEIHERIVSIRESHDAYWEQYKQYREERAKIQEEKRRAWEEGKARREAAKERIRANIDKNEEKLSKARDALRRHQQRCDDLRDQIASAWSDSFRERAEGWLEEAEGKVADIEQHIDRLEGWISEDEGKLRSFD
ncbi:MAG TPA: hypothetical protein VIP46_16795 [Pyrinomonadaceae bacterium]